MNYSFIPFKLVIILLLIMIVENNFAGTDIKVNNDTDSTTQNEPSITVNQHFSGDPLNIVVAYNDIGKTLGASYSPDSGKTWFDTQLPYVWGITGDPSVASDNSGNVYACFLSYEGTWFYGKSGIYVSKSIDGGRTWGTPAIVDQQVYPGTGAPVPFTDKCFMTVDTNSSSPFAGNVYVGWQRDNTNGSNSDIYFGFSNNGGISFSTPIKINDNSPQTAYAEGAFPFVGADGDVYVTWYDSYFKGGVPGSLYVDISVNGGVTFGTDIKAANFLGPLKYTCDCSNFKTKCFPAGAADPSDPEKLYLTYISDPDGYFDVRIDVGDDPGAAHSDKPNMTRDGNYVYVVWEDYRNGIGSDIFFNRSTDNGQTWELSAIGPLDNNTSPGTSPSMNAKVDAIGNYVYCVWEDLRSGMNDIYFNRSVYYGKTWQTDQFIDGSNTTIGGFPVIASADSNVYLAWEDNRHPSNDEIYFSYSNNNGTSFSPPVLMSTGDVPGNSRSYSPRLACSGNYVYCMWIDTRTGSFQPWVSYSLNNGVNWQPPVMISQGLGSFCRIPLEGGLECTGNYVYACWADDRSAVYEIYFNRSINNGLVWGSDIQINNGGFTCGFPDMNINGNNVYIAWHDDRNNPGAGPSDIYYDFSTDNGLTWLGPDVGPLDVGGIGIFSMGVKLESDNNNVYACWYDSRAGGGMGEIYFNSSRDNGATWGSDVLINTGTLPFALPLNAPFMSAGNDFVNIVWPDPRCVYIGMGQQDIFSNYSSDSGTTWLNGPDEADVFCVRSTNGGATWQLPVRVNDNNSIDPDVLPFVAVKENGFVDIIYYNFRSTPLDPMALGAQALIAVSTDEGVSFKPSVIVQDTVVTPLTKWVGEYIGVAVVDSFAFSVFVDNEINGNSDIYFDVFVNPVDTGCCVVRGDALHDNGLILVNDLVFLVNHVFKGGPPPICPEEGDALADNGLILVNDLVYLVNYVFKGGPPPPPC